jgi:hypothetical protein
MMHDPCRRPMISRRWSLSTSFMLPRLRVLHVDRSGTPAGRQLSRRSIPRLECRDASGRRQADLWGIGPEVELLGRLVLGDTPARIRRRTPTSGDKLTQFRHYVERAVAADDSLLGPGATRRLIENHAATDRPWCSVRMSRPDRRARSALQDDTRDGLRRTRSGRGPDASRVAGRPAPRQQERTTCRGSRRSSSAVAPAWCRRRRGSSSRHTSEGVRRGRPVSTPRTRSPRRPRGTPPRCCRSTPRPRCARRLPRSPHECRSAGDVPGMR